MKTQGLDLQVLIKHQLMSTGVKHVHEVLEGNNSSFVNKKIRMERIKF